MSNPSDLATSGADRAGAGATVGPDAGLAPGPAIDLNRLGRLIGQIQAALAGRAAATR